MSNRPPSAELITQVDAASGSWWQGDVADAKWFAHFQYTADRTADEARSDSPIETSLEPIDGLVILTQTCDIRRSYAVRPYVHVSPLIFLDGSEAKLAKLGKLLRFVPVSGGGENAFADTDRVMTLDKSFLLERGRRIGCDTDEQRRMFGRRVGRVHHRFAFPDDLHAALKDLVDRVKKKYRRDDAEGRALRSVYEIRATAEPNWQSQSIEVTLTFLIDENEVVPSLTDDVWATLVEGWEKLCKPTGVIRNIYTLLLPLAEMTAREYVDSDCLDLEDMSY